ncbi:MAG: hypothetical protein M5U09_03690 [Gammaproteobacteria bacterium]|nr:hypothetical protein [Gammaproteobacteria bacterium]
MSDAGAFAYVRASNDVNDVVYGAVFGFYPVDDAAVREGSGVVETCSASSKSTGRSGPSPGRKQVNRRVVRPNRCRAA